MTSVKAWWAARDLRAKVLIVAAVVVLIIVGQVTNGGTPKTNPAAPTPPAPPVASAGVRVAPAAPRADPDAQRYIRDHGLDAARIAATVGAVQIEAGVTQGAPNQANVDQLAQAAQQAHDTIGALRDSFATTDYTGKVNDAQINVFAGAGDLHDAMTALVDYAGNPNAATLARFTTPYQRAVAEWDDGVTTIWRLARTSHPPKI